MERPELKTKKWLRKDSGILLNLTPPIIKYKRFGPVLYILKSANKACKNHKREKRGFLPSFFVICLGESIERHVSSPGPTACLWGSVFARGILVTKGVE